MGLSNSLRTNVLIPDGESFHLIAVLQSLSESKDYRIYVLSEKKQVSMRYSRFVREFIYTDPDLTTESLASKINQLVSSKRIDVILPLTEKGIQCLLHCRHLLDKPYQMLIPDSESQLTKVRNKGLLAAYLATHNFPMPQTLVLTKGQEMHKVTEDLRFPVLAKPVLGIGGGIGIKRLKEPGDLRTFLENCSNPDDYLVQNEVEGHDLGCNVLCRNGKILAYTIQVGNLFSNKPFSPQVGLDFIHIDEVYNLVSSLMASLGWNGVANVDLRYDRQNDRYLVLEVNPRYWLTLIASTMAGVNFPKLYCEAVLDKLPEYTDFREMPFLHQKGIVQTLREQPMLFFRWQYIWRHTPIRYLLRDPGMTIYHYAWSTRNRVLSFLGIRKLPHERISG